jgi:hypothetical protein
MVRGELKTNPGEGELSTSEGIGRLSVGFIGKKESQFIPKSKSLRHPEVGRPFGAQLPQEFLILRIYTEVGSPFGSFRFRGKSLRELLIPVKSFRELPG